MCTAWENPGVHKKLYGVAFLRFSLSLPFLCDFPIPWGSPFWSPRQKSQSLIPSSCHVFPWLNWKPKGRRTESTKKKMQQMFISLFQDHSSVNWIERFPPFFWVSVPSFTLHPGWSVLISPSFHRNRKSSNRTTMFDCRELHCHSSWGFYHLNYAVNGNLWNWAVDDL